MPDVERNKERFLKSLLYAITDFKEWSDRELFRIEQACRAGADIIQLRSKSLDRETFKKAGKEVRKVTARWNALFIVNDSVDVAIAADADGVHLGQDDMSLPNARRILGDKKILMGKSTHSIEQALIAQDEGADYIGIGPIFATPTKPDYPPVGLEIITQVKKQVSTPAVVIGGIDAARISVVIENGAERIAVVRAIFGANNVYESTKRLRAIIENCISKNQKSQFAESA